MAFELTDFHYAKLTAVTNRVEKHGDDDKPAVSLGFAIEDANTLLDVIDPQIRHALYKAVEGQEQLPGVEPATPVLRCNAFDSHRLTTSHEGWTLAVDYGIDGEDEPQVFGGCKVDKFVVDAKQGGSVVLSFRVGTSDVDADKLGILAMQNGQDVSIKLTAPKPKADAIDGTQAAFDADHPNPDGDGPLFADDSPEAALQRVGGDPEDEDSEGGATDEQQREHKTLSPAEAWPFPTDNRPAAPSTRTARGRAKTAAALAAGDLS